VKYILVKWKHSFPGEPIWLYSELDNAYWEVRKVEVFRDGSRGYASATESRGTTRLGEEPVPSLENIATDPQFEPIEITREEFEQVWSKRKTHDNILPS
jgi:hypothetical protein